MNENSREPYKMDHQHSIQEEQGFVPDEEFTKDEPSYMEEEPEGPAVVTFLLQPCPECGSRLVGIIDIGPNHRWLRDCKKLYQKHRCLLRYVEPRDYDWECFPNRFCASCGFEWMQEEGFLHKDRYVSTEFETREDYEGFLEETEFSFDPYILKHDDKHFSIMRPIKRLCNAFLSRIHKFDTD